MGFFDKIKQGLAKTKEAIAETWNDVFSVSELDDDFYDELEESLIVADLGTETAAKAHFFFPFISISPFSRPQRRKNTNIFCIPL